MQRQAHTLARLSPYFAKGNLTASMEIGGRPFPFSDDCLGGFWMWGQADRQEVRMNAKIAVVGCMAILVGCMSLEERLASNDPEVRLGAEKELTAQACYAANATQAMAIADKITDEDCLCQLVLYAKTKEVRESAKSKLKAEKSFAILAAASANEAEAVEAFGKIKDQKLILQVSQAAKTPKIKQLAAQSITDSEVLFRLAMSSIWKFMTTCKKDQNPKLYKSPLDPDLFGGDDNEDSFVACALVVQEYFAKIKDEAVLKRLLSMLEPVDKKINVEGVELEAYSAFKSPDRYAEDVLREKERDAARPARGEQNQKATPKFRGERRKAEIARIANEIRKQAQASKNRWATEVSWLGADQSEIVKYAFVGWRKPTYKGGWWTSEFGAGQATYEEVIEKANKAIARNEATFVVHFRDILLENYIEVGTDDQVFKKIACGGYGWGEGCCNSFWFDTKAIINDGVKLSPRNSKNTEIIVKAAGKIKDQKVLADMLVSSGKRNYEHRGSIKAAFVGLISNLNDNEIKKSILLESEWPSSFSSVCAEAVKAIDNEDVVFAIAEASKVFAVKKAAFETLKDQKRLMLLALNPGRDIPGLPNDRSVLWAMDYKGEFQKARNARKYFTRLAANRISDVELLKELKGKVQPDFAAEISKRIRKMGGADDKADVERIIAASKKSKAFTLKGFYVGMPIEDAQILAEHYWPDSNVAITSDNRIEIDVVHEGRFDKIPMCFCTADKAGSVYRFNFTKKQLEQWFKYETHTHENWAKAFAAEQKLNLTPISIADQWTIDDVSGTVQQEAFEFRDKELEYRVVYFGKTKDRSDADFDRISRNQYKTGKVAGFLNTWFGGWLNGKGAEDGTLRIEQLRD